MFKNEGAAAPKLHVWDLPQIGDRFDDTRKIFIDLETYEIVQAKDPGKTLAPRPGFVDLQNVGRARFAEVAAKLRASGVTESYIEKLYVYRLLA